MDLDGISTVRDFAHYLLLVNPEWIRVEEYLIQYVEGWILIEYPMRFSVAFFAECPCEYVTYMKGAKFGAMGLLILADVCN